MISTPYEHSFGMQLPSLEIRKQEIEKLFDELSISNSETNEHPIVKIN